MAKVVAIDDYLRKWITAEAECKSCGAHFAVVYPDGASSKNLECGSCGEMELSVKSGPRLVMGMFGGNCPVQAEGTLDGKEFYFRARGSSWSFGIGGDPIMAPEWEHREEWLGGPFAAGWMETEDAMRCIGKAIALYDAR